MSTVQTPAQLLDEIADLFASRPSREEILAFRLSAAVQQQARELLEKCRSGHISPEEQRELDQFEQVDLLMSLVKARLRLQQP